MSAREDNALDRSEADASPRETDTTERLNRSLREHTPARVALRRAGTTLATTEVLAFQLAHARARDAVKTDLDLDAFAERLRRELRMTEVAETPVLVLKSAAPDREAYLRHPGLGRTLDPDSAARLQPSPCDVAFVIADGLSSVAVERHAIPLLNAVLPGVVASGWSCGPICVVKQARVAIGDAVGAGLGSLLSVVLIGERPGLSSPDSLGAYITWKPRPGRTDAERNCISNIRGGGLSYEPAAARLLWYLGAARARGLTGTGLKEQSNFLID